MEALLTKEEATQESLPLRRVSRGYLFAKRFFDIVSSLCVSLVLLIPMAVIALVIMIKDPGSPFYMQKRVGQDGREIGVLKFRSMRKNADHLEDMLTPEQLEEYKKEYKLEDDPRLIGYKKPGDGRRCFGSKLRRSSMDELPQIPWNILIKGNMSVVGPRPVLAEELQMHYTPEQQRLFLSAKPGLTGYWQAYARNDASYEFGKRQEMELYYVDHQSPWLDMVIILKTVVAVVKKTGAE